MLLKHSVLTIFGILTAMTFTQFINGNFKDGNVSLYIDGPNVTYVGNTNKTIMYTISVVTKNGSDTYLNLSASFSSEFTIKDFSTSTGATVTQTDNTLTTSFDSPNAYQIYTLTVVGFANSLPCDSYITIDANATTNASQDSANASFNIFVPETSVPYLDIEQAVSSTQINEDIAFIYTITVTNNSGMAASNVVVTDILPQNLSLIGPIMPPAGWTAMTAVNPATGGTTVKFTNNSFDSGTPETFTIIASGTLSTYPSAQPFRGALVNIPTVSADNFPFTNYAPAVYTILGPTSSAETLDFTASVSTGVVSPGQQFSYAVTTIGSPGTSPFTLTTVLPPGVTFQSVLISGSSSITLTSQSGQTLTFTISDAENLLTITINVVANSPMTDVTVLPFYASIVSNDDAYQTSSSVNNLLVTYPDLAINMSLVPSIIAGQQITYPITVTNNGNESATGVIVRVSLPSGVTYSSITSGDSWTFDQTSSTATLSGLASGHSSTFFLTANVAQTLGAGNITTTACVSCSIPDPDPSNNEASITTAVTSQASFSLNKVSSDPVVNAGDMFSYMITAINNGPSAATNVMLTDQIPSELTIGGITPPGGWEVAPLGNTLTFTRTASSPFLVGSVVFTIPVTANSNIGQGQIGNTAQISADNASTVLASSLIDTGSSVLQITKSLSSPCITPGSSYLYTITVTNTDSGPISNPVVSDAIPSGFSVGMITYPSGWTNASSGNNVQFTYAGNFPNGESATFFIPVTASNTIDSGALINSASFSAQGLSAVQSTVGACASSNSSLVFSKSGQPMVIAGNTMPYTIAVNNKGSEAENVIVSDTFPDGVTFVSGSGTGWTITPTQGNGGIIATNSSIGANSMSTFSVNVQVAPSVTGTLENFALLSSSLNNSNSVSNTVTTTVGTTAQVNLAKICPQSLTIGASGLYQITVTNNGPSDAQHIVVTDTLPAGVTFVAGLSSDWNFSNVNNTVTAIRPVLPANSTSTFYIQVYATTLVSNMITNNVSLYTATPNTGTLTTSCSSALIGDTSDLAITQTATVNGASIEYTITVTNLGPTINSNIEVVDLLPVGASYVSSSGTGWTFSYANGSLTATLPTLAIGASASFNLVVDPNENMSNQTLVNTGVVFGALLDPNLENNISTSEVVVNPLSDLAISQTTPENVTVKTPLEYTITVTNLGPADNTTIEVVDLLPQGVTFVSATGDGWSFGPVVNGTLTATLPALASGESASFNLVATINSSITDPTLVNTARVSGTLTDPQLDNNISSSEVALNLVSDLAISQSAPATVLEQSRIQYVITVTNLGPANNTGIEVIDLLPQGVTVVSATGDGWNFGPVTNGTITATLPTLAAGASASFNLLVAVNKGISNQNLVNTASVSGTLVDPNQLNTISSSVVFVIPASDTSRQIISKYCLQN